MNNRGKSIRIIRERNRKAVTAKRGNRFSILLLTALAIIMVTAVPAYATTSARADDGNTDYTVSQMHNGYCAITFTVPGTSKEVFLTGIREDKADEIYHKFIDAWQDGQKFSVADESFIDAEKPADSDDSELSASAAASNMLVYSGWAAQIDPALKLLSEDDLFAKMIPEFSGMADDYLSEFDTLGTLEWFFSGALSSEQKAVNGEPLSPRGYPNSGGYLTAYDVSSLGTRGSFDGLGYTMKLKDILAELRAGSAVEVDNDTCAVTCFGMITDPTYPDTDEAYYQSFIVADSNDDKEAEEKDRRKLPDKLEVVPVGSRSLFGAKLKGFAVLKPYDGSAGIETDQRASWDRRQDPDLRIRGMSMDTEPGSALLTGSVIPEGEECHLNIGIQEYSDVNFNGIVSIRASLSRDNTEVAVREMTEEVSLESYKTGYFSLDFSSEELTAGNYRVSVTVEAALPGSEAFLCNNTAEYNFTVTKDKLQEMVNPTIELDIENVIMDDTAAAYIHYSDQDLELLRSADAAAVAIAHYDEGEDPDYQVPDNYGFGDDGLPSDVSIYKEKNFTEACVSACIDGRVYRLHSPIYRIPRVRLTVTLGQDETEEFTPVPYGSTHLNEGEEISFVIKNESVACDDAFSGEYYLSDSISTGSPLSETEEFTLLPGETSTEFRVAGWDEPLVGDTNLYLAWQEEGGSFKSTNAAPIGTLRVIPDELFKVHFEPNGGTGTMEDIEVASGRQIDLPASGFAAPTGKLFSKWREGKTHYAAGEKYTVEGNRTFEALYRDKLLAGHSVDIGNDAVNVSFFLTLSDEVMKDGASVRFHWGENEENIELSGDCYDPEKQAYRAICSLKAPDKNEVITAEILRDGRVIAVRTYSLEKYLSDMQSNLDEFWQNDYQGDEYLPDVFDDLSDIIAQPGDEELPGDVSFPYLPSLYDSEDTGAEDMPSADEEQWDFEEGVISGGYVGVYDGKAHTITLTIPEGAEAKFGTEEGNYDLDEKPTYTGVGAYKVYYKVSKDDLIPVTGSEDVIIKKANPAVTDPLARDLTYNGSAQKLVKAGSAKGGKLLYALGKNADEAPKEDQYSEKVPSKTAAGTYYVWYKTIGDENHNNIGPACVPATIKRKDISEAEIKLSDKKLPYSGVTQIVYATSVELNGEVIPTKAYKVTGGFSGLQPGEYTLTLEGVGNYTGQASEVWIITAEPSATPTPTATPGPKPTGVTITPRPAKSPATTASPSAAASPSPKAAGGAAGAAGGGAGGGGASGSSASASGGAVGTGDDSNPALWAILMAACAVVVLSVVRNKTNTHKD